MAPEVVQNGLHGLYGIQSIHDVVQVLIMVFAGDVILTSRCIASLQKQIDIMKSFADCFPMSVNLKKTKIVVFRKGGFWQEMKCGNKAI